jgi:hypothetical protein
MGDPARFSKASSQISSRLYEKPLVAFMSLSKSQKATQQECKGYLFFENCKVFAKKDKITPDKLNSK